MGGARGAEALREAVAQVAAGELTRPEALLRITAEDLEQVLHAQFESDGDVVLTTGLGASPGAAVGQVYFTADDCVNAADRGERVVLVRDETSPEDVHGMQLAEGILTTRGGLASHAAVVARGWGIPAVVGAEAVQIGDGWFTVGSVTVRAGDVISLDGATGEVVAGERGVVRSEPPPELATVLGWADEVRADRIGVRANADNGPDAAAAVAFGAEGIGLCRTEHMFLGDDRLPLVRALLLATDLEAEAAALVQLGVAQRDDFAEILRALDGRPLTVRLLDAPLHEFLPAGEAGHEHNPMLGTRGVRLAALKPGLYEMQVRALVEAAVADREAGGAPLVEVMIPLTINGAELARARGWVEAAIADTPGGASVHVAIGTMVETPRAALVAGELAAVADFFSFGTNDLTQMTYGFSRDDVEARLVPEYLAAGILPANPFETLDRDGVGALVALAIERGRAANPAIQLGVCGEHGGDPTSIAHFVHLGVGYVSCSPYRIPVARLAAAQAILGVSRPPDDAR